MIDTIIRMLSYDFTIKALIVGILVSLCASLLGVSLVLKKYSMIGDGLSHVGFGALAIATVLHIAPLPFSLLVVILVAFALLRLNENNTIKGDSAIAIISAGSMAIGVLVISLTPGTNINIGDYLFGSILAIADQDAALSIVPACLVLLLYVLFYKKIFAVTFDEKFASATGVKTNLYNLLIAILTSITIVLGMRLMGSLLISSLIIFPAITSMQVFKTFKSVIISSASISVICFLIGMIISFAFDSPVGATIVCMNIIILLLFSFINLLQRKGILHT